MRRRQIVVPLIVPAMPAELRDPSSETWTSVESSRTWLEKRRLIRRLRLTDWLEAMTPIERHAFAMSVWSPETERQYA